MASPSDNTAVFRMDRGFQEFLSNKSSSKLQTPGIRRKFSESFLDASHTVEVRDSKSPKLSMSKTSQSSRQLSVELSAAKAQISDLQAQMIQQKAVHQKELLEKDLQIDGSKLQLQEAKAQLHQALDQAKRFQTQEKNLQEDIMDLRKKLTHQKAEYEDKVSTCSQEKSLVQQDYNQLQMTSRETLHKLTQEYQTCKTDLLRSEEQVQHTQRQLNLTKRQLGEAKQQVEELERFRKEVIESQENIRELEQQLSRLKEEGLISGVAAEHLDRLKHLEKENRKLSEENVYFHETQDNNIILREENQDLQSKNSQLEEQIKELSAGCVELEVLKKKMEEWTSGCSPNTKVSSPAALFRNLSQLQTENALLLDSQRTLKSQLQEVQGQLSSKDKEVKSLQSQTNSLQTKHKELGAVTKRLEKRLLLIRKERDAYKGVIDSYENDLASGNVSFTGQPWPQLQQLNQSYSQQVDELDALVRQRNEEIGQLRNKVAQLEQNLLDSASQRPQTSASDNQLISNLRNKVAELEKSLEKLEEEKFTLEAYFEKKSITGDYNPLHTKVIHLEDNPLARAEQKRSQLLLQLQKENQLLKGQIKVMEEAGFKGTDLPEKVQVKLQEESTSKEMEEYKEKVTSLELKNKRLLEAFEKTSLEFREVCYEVLGYRIDILGTNKYKLMSMYAEGPNDTLMFQKERGGTISLMDNAFSRTLTDKIDTYLVGSNSIPAFLSALTLDLFSRQTMIME